MLKGFFFGYIYYRLFHLNSNKGDYQGVPAAVTISLIEMLLLLDTQIILNELFFEHLSFGADAKIIAYGGVIIYLILTVFNYQRYSKRLDEFNENWGKDNLVTRRIKGFLILLSIILPFTPLLIVTRL